MTPTDPIPVRVTRYRCPHCARSHSARRRAVEHIGRCWFDPDNRTCKTCANYEPPESGGCFGDPQCNCPDTPQNCTAGVDLPDFGGEMVTGCEKWESTS